MHCVRGAMYYELAVVIIMTESSQGHTKLPLAAQYALDLVHNDSRDQLKYPLQD